MPRPSLTESDARHELGADRCWTCAGCGQRFTAEPELDAAGNLYGPCCADTYVSTIDDVLEQAGADHDAAVARVEAMLCPDCGGDIEPATEVMGIAVDGEHACAAAPIGSRKSECATESAWLATHEAQWGRAGVAAIARDGISPYAWDFPFALNRKRVQELAAERLRTIEATEAA